MTKNKLHKVSAFTLIELAIVLVVIGILVGMGVGLVGMLTKRAKYNEAKEVVDAAVESVINFAAFKQWFIGIGFTFLVVLITVTNFIAK